MSEFRTNLGETVYYGKYAHDGAQTWAELAHTVVEDVCQEWMSKEDKAQLTEYIRDFKFVPGGRYIYYAGRPNRYYNNCFSGDTQLLTDKGWKSFSLIGDGSSVNVWSPVTNSFLPATMHKHGMQVLQEITFVPADTGKKYVERKVKATPDHKWLLTDGSTTESLSVGDTVPAADICGDNLDGYIHGLVFADGSRGRQRVRDGKWTHQIRLCGSKADRVNDFVKAGHSVTYPKFAKGDPVVYVVSDRNLKGLPVLPYDPADYCSSFIRGWVDFDGSEQGRILHTTDLNALYWFEKYAPLAGFVITGQIRENNRSTNYGERNSPLYSLRWQRAESFNGWRVQSIDPLPDAEVWCPFEPIHNQIVVDHGIHTYQCYLLKAEEDTREDWAGIAYRATACLMTGGGIGIDYSVYRESGRKLSRTGGLASGPLPAMEMINEIGRRVKQGGSRRSAIYASLNWQHGDAEDFLVAKNWHEHRLNGTGLTVADMKERHFDYHAPLDHTNISLNYDDAWLDHPDRDTHPVFLKNVEQALSTAEPGFSFNFREKQNETLRNACTEVTSEDDSDVCNLGSVNMARVQSLDEFADVVDLATRFLLCGTLRAHLPYEKVAQVRAKNRRLGLGLMGMHEWLLQRGQPYEVTPEMHDWLYIYKHQSDQTSRAFADKLGISRPVANRAIAPTGSIGMLAGTTTGIEPIYTVAYKRRYQKDNRWHYQYAVDPTAEAIVQSCGVDPSSLDTAMSMAYDPERRIKFQADVQDYVDMGISSTLNLPKWGSEHNNPDKVEPFAKMLSQYAPRLRGFTCYPDGARGGQPITECSYEEAKKHEGGEFIEEGIDVCDITGKGGTCGS